LDLKILLIKLLILCESIKIDQEKNTNEYPVQLHKKHPTKIGANAIWSERTRNKRLQKPRVQKTV
jgi:hypothetical protein